MTVDGRILRELVQTLAQLKQIMNAGLRFE